MFYSCYSSLCFSPRNRRSTLALTVHTIRGAAGMRPKRPWNFFLPLEIEKTTFFANNFKIQGGSKPPCPPSDAHEWSMCQCLGCQSPYTNINPPIQDFLPTVLAWNDHCQRSTKSLLISRFLHFQSANLKNH